jgi:hypothetical protein
MELRPVERIRGVGLIGARVSGGDVVPAIAVRGTGRMEEGSYGSSGKGQGRGLEDEDADLGEPEETSSGSVDVMA